MSGELEVPWQESFALYPEKREQLVGSLLPSDDDFYFYSIVLQLSRLQPGDGLPKETVDLLARLKKRGYMAPRFKQLQTRCELIEMQAKGTSEKRVAELKKKFGKEVGVTLLHDPPHVEGKEREKKYKSVMKLKTLQEWKDIATKFSAVPTTQYRPCAWDLIQPTNMTNQDRIELLSTLASNRRHDVPYLAQLVKEQLLSEQDSPYQTKISERDLKVLFEMLTNEELASLSVAIPISHLPPSYVAVRVRKMLPEELKSEVPMDQASEEALYKIHSFTKKLPLAFQEIKFHIHHWVLRVAWANRNMDSTRIISLFQEYVQFPRALSASDEKSSSSSSSSQKAPAKKSKFKSIFSKQEITTKSKKSKNLAFRNEGLPSHLCASSSQDVELLRNYLAHYFVSDPENESLSPYDESLDRKFLTDIMANSKLCACQGDAQKWCNLLNNPSGVQKLKEEVEIKFVNTNKVQFLPDEEVNLVLELKNVPKLIVKMFEVNTENYYKQNFSHVDTAVDLDGLVAREENLLDFSKFPPIRRFEHTFPFPSLKGRRGVFVLEFIGGGKSSRALIHKGWLNYVSYSTAAGQVVTIIDENKKKVQDASVFLGGRTFHAGKNGDILIPFRESGTSSEKILLCCNGYTSLDNFEWKAESYTLLGGIHIDREGLLPSATCEAAVHLQLFVNSAPAPLDCITSVNFSMNATTHAGVTVAKGSDLTSQLKKICDSKTHAELLFPFTVPPACASLSCTVTATVQVVSRGTTETKTINQDFEIGGLAKTMTISETFFQPDASNGLSFLVLGRAGEPIVGEVKTVKLNHRWLNGTVSQTLQTDEKGRITLQSGEAGATSLCLSSVSCGDSRWDVPHSLNRSLNYPESIYHQAGSGGVHVLKPTLATKSQLGLKKDAHFASLFEVTTNGLILANHTSKITEDGAFYVINGLNSGLYRFTLKAPTMSGLQAIEIRVVPSGVPSIGPYWINGADCLENQKQRSAPLAIRSVKTTLKDKAGAELTIKLSNCTKTTRVHIIRSQFSPPFSLYDDLRCGGMKPPSSIHLSSVQSRFVTGRELGDEFRYIIDRRYQEIYAGSLAPAPTFQVHPWVVREIGESRGMAATGDAYGAAIANASHAMRDRLMSRKASGSNCHNPLADFLRAPSTRYANLKPSKRGHVTIPVDPEGGPFFQVVAIDGDQIVGTSGAFLKDSELVCRQLALSDLNSLDAGLHYVEEQVVTLLARSETFNGVKAGSQKVEVFSTIEKVISYYEKLGVSVPKDFEVLTSWKGLSEEAKREKYESLASHELNFFLLCNDFAFFEAVVLPELRIKSTKTFLDYFFLDDQEVLSSYLQPFLLNQLNTFELILLGAALNRLEDIERSLRDNDETHSASQSTISSRFSNALSMGGLEEQEPSGGYGGLAGAGGGAARGGRRMRRRSISPMAQSNRFQRRTSICMMNRQLSCSLDSCSDQCSYMDSCSDDDCFSYDECEEEEEEEDDCASLLFDTQELMLERKIQMNNVQNKKDSSFRMTEKTKEWEERGYYNKSVTTSKKNLVTPSLFWVDYASFLQSEAKKAGVSRPSELLLKNLVKVPFLSANFHLLGGDSCPCFTEYLFAISVLGFPFEADIEGNENALPKITYMENGSVAEVMASELFPSVVFHADLRPSSGEDGDEEEGSNSGILVAQTISDPTDPFKDNGEEKYLSPEHEFVPNHPYVCKVIITNVSSAQKTLRLLTQVPTGSLPLETLKQMNGGFYTISQYTTQTFSFKFYFPQKGKFEHYPAHVSIKGKPVGWAEKRTFRVVDKPERIEKSWKNIARFGTDEEVISALKEKIRGKTLSFVYFRLQEKAFYEQLLALFRSNVSYDRVIWGYSFLHDDQKTMKEFLENEGRVESMLGKGVFASPILTLDPMERLWYVHREYSPLIEARTHQLGERRKLLNDGLRAQYTSFLDKLCFQEDLSLSDAATGTYFLFLMLRDAEAIHLYERYKEKEGKTGENEKGKLSKEFLDYLEAYICVKKVDLEGAKKISEQYREHSIARIRERFDILRTHTEEALSVSPIFTTEKKEKSLASTKPAFNLSVKGDAGFTVAFQNLTESLVVNYYVMDIELLFSTSPFSVTSENTSKFSYVLPTASETISLDDLKKGEGESQDGKGKLTHPIPEKYSGANLMVEVKGHEIRKSAAYFANKMKVMVVDSFGQLQVTDSETGKPLPKAYVKVYSRKGGGGSGGAFYKDGYTDVRGIFDYASLSNEKLRSVKKFAILVISEKHGALITEANPPPL